MFSFSVMYYSFVPERLRVLEGAFQCDNGSIRKVTRHFRGDSEDFRGFQLHVRGIPGGFRGVSIKGL